MLLRHSFYYLFAQGVPGLVNFVALAVYTRLLVPEAFGRYALLLVGIGLANVVIFQWLRLVLARFLQSNCGEPQRFLGGILALFLTLALVVTGVGGLLILLWTDPIWQRLLAVALPLLLAQAFFELTLCLFQSRLEIGRYARFLSSKTVLALVIGGFLAWAGWGTIAPLTGLLIANGVALVVFAFAAWRYIAPRWPEAHALRAQLRYGLPLTVTFALGWVVSSSDRLMIAWYINESAAGLYAAGYDTAFQGLTMLLGIINTAAYPLAVFAMEKGGATAVRKQLTQNGAIIVTAALAGATGLIVLAPHFVGVLIGMEFRDGALLILPWVAIAAAVSGIKAFHLDIAFHLGYQSFGLVVTSALAALVNLLLNLFLIPRFGFQGAAWSTLLSIILAAFASACLGRRVFALPKFIPIVLRGAGVALSLGLGAHWGAKLGNSHWVSLGGGIGGGMALAITAIFAINLAGLRDAVIHHGRHLAALIPITPNKSDHR